MLKPLSTALIAAVLLLSTSYPAGAFKSFTAFGGAVHDQITRSALGKAGFKEASLKFVDKSCYGQDLVGTPAFTESRRHFDDCELKASHDYVESCYLDIDKHVCAAGKNLADKKSVLDLTLGGEPAKQSGPAKYAPRKTYQSQLITMSGNKYLRFQVDLPDWTKDGLHLCGAKMARFSKAGMAAVKKNAFPSVKLEGTK